MTMLQDLLAEVGDDAPRVDPTRLAAQAMDGATRHRRRTKIGAVVGTAAALGLVVVVSQLAGPTGTMDAAQPGAGSTNRTFYSPGLHPVLRLLLAAGFAVAAGYLVGWRDGKAGPAPSRVERSLAGLWGASVALWVVSAAQLVHAVLIGLPFLGHPYVALLSAGVVPALAVGLLVNGSVTVRRLTVLTLTAQSAVVVSLLSATPGSQVFGGPGPLSFALTLGQAAVALVAAGLIAWRGRTAGGASPSWQLPAVWSAGVVVIVNLFVHRPAGPDVGVIYYSDDRGYLALSTGSLANGVSWAAGSLAALLVGLALWRTRESGAGVAVVVGLMVTLLAGFSLDLYSNTFPTIGRGWGPYLAFWWLSGPLVVAWLVARHRMVRAGVGRYE